MSEAAEIDSGDKAAGGSDPASLAAIIAAAPQIAGIIALDIGAQQIAAFAPPGLPQFLPVQCEVECF
jgi:hypothetical protein